MNDEGNDDSILKKQSTCNAFHSFFLFLIVYDIKHCDALDQGLSSISIRVCYYYYIIIYQLYLHGRVPRNDKTHIIFYE